MTPLSIFLTSAFWQFAVTPVNVIKYSPYTLETFKFDDHIVLTPTIVVTGLMETKFLPPHRTFQTTPLEFVLLCIVVTTWRHQLSPTQLRLHCTIMTIYTLILHFVTTIDCIFNLKRPKLVNSYQIH